MNPPRRTRTSYRSISTSFPSGDARKIRVHFDLVQDEDGYPPASVETLWATALGKGRFRIDNIPFFVCGVSCFDIVSGKKRADGAIWFEGLAEESGHSTIRVKIARDSIDMRSMDARVEELRADLRKLGCDSERSHIPGLFSIDIPPESPYQPVKEILENGDNRGLWDYEEATLAHSR